MKSIISPTEKIYPKKFQIDELSTQDAFDMMLDDQAKVIDCIKKSKQSILKVVELITSHLKKYKKSRLIYCGAGTSGRIAVQDGVELIPTFGLNEKMIDFIIAGGKKALIKSIENAEDDLSYAQECIKKKKN